MESYKPNSILISGSVGFIALHVANRLIRNYPITKLWSSTNLTTAPILNISFLLITCMPSALAIVYSSTQPIILLTLIFIWEFEKGSRLRCFIPINFICADMDESPYLTGDLAGLKQNKSSLDVVFSELKGVAERIVNVSLSCEVHYCVDGLRDEKVVEKISTDDVALNELQVWGRSRRGKVFKVGAVVEFVEDHNFIIRVIADKPVGNIRCDETSSPGDEDAFRKNFVV